MPLTRPLFLGHRGTRHNPSAPENTLAAFDAALAAGCDGFEFDVRMSADRHAVLCHDENFGNLTISRNSARRLGLPVLSEVLGRYQHTAFLDIELKVPGLEVVTAELLREKRPANFVVSSFIPKVLKTLRGIDGSIPLGLICETQGELGEWATLPVEYVIAHHKLLTQDRVAELKAAEKKIFTWTVNDALAVERLAGWGVDGIISDDPEMLASTPF